MTSLRFVIQEHRKIKTRHFDLMLESGNALMTWSFDKALDKSGSAVQILTSLPEHRLLYLTYQGKISRGRGAVKIWDKGNYQKILWNKDCKIIQIRGAKIEGYFAILNLLPRLPARLIRLIRS